MSTMASQITSLTIVYSIVYLSADHRKHQNFALLAFMWGIHRRSVNSLHKGPITRKIFPFDDVIINISSQCWFPDWRPHSSLKVSQENMSHSCFWVSWYNSWLLMKHDRSQTINYHMKLLCNMLPSRNKLQEINTFDYSMRPNIYHNRCFLCGRDIQLYTWTL